MSTTTHADNDVEIKQQRVRLYPGWWTHIGATGESRPFYRVEVQSQKELALAKRLQPDCVRANFRLEEIGRR